jgi:protein TonB
MKLYLFLLSIIIVGSLYGQGKNTAPSSFDTIYTKPTVLASYPGGDTAWKRYVKKHLKYPRKAWWAEIETDVVVRVVINKDGSIATAQHLTTSGYGFEKEAGRLVLQSGRWIPAYHRGVAVKSEGELKIEFRLR